MASGGNIRDMDYNGSYDTGSFDVSCDSMLYGSGRITLEYRIHSKFNSEYLSGILVFIQENYRQAYDKVLAGVFFSL